MPVLIYFILSYL